MLDKLFPFHILVFLSSLFLTVMIERILIPILKKKAEQPIYEDGPRWHKSKSGTPTMGGIAFVIAFSISLFPAAIFLFFSNQTDASLSLIITLLFCIGNAFIGLWDDLTKLKRRENAGLKPWQKLIFQFILALLFVIANIQILGAETTLNFSFGKLELGAFYYPLLIFVMVGLINSANLTDGIDGLAASVSFSVGVSLFFISAALSPELSFISSALIGISIGFLFFNANPAKIFMGDTGSLFIGACIASSAALMQNPIVMLFIAGVYVIECISVILQVAVFKISGKRLFKMAPLHHHLEKSGLGEMKICFIAILLTFVLSIPAYIFYLP